MCDRDDPVFEDLGTAKYHVILTDFELHLSLRCLVHIFILRGFFNVWRAFNFYESIGPPPHFFLGF